MEPPTAPDALALELPSLVTTGAVESPTAADALALDPAPHADSAAFNPLTATDALALDLPPHAEAAAVDLPTAADALALHLPPHADAAAVDPLTSADALALEPPALADAVTVDPAAATDAFALEPPNEPPPDAPAAVDAFAAASYAVTIALSYFSKTWNSLVWSANDAPEPPISCMRTCMSFKMGVSNWPGLAMGLLETAGSQLRASPTRSYVACASVATEERPSASGSSTGSRPDAPRGGLAAELSVRAAEAAACAAWVACVAAWSASTSVRDESSAAARSKPKRFPPASSPAEATGAAAASRSAGRGTRGGTGGMGDVAGSGPTCRGGIRLLTLRGRWGCFFMTCHRMPMAVFTTPQIEHVDGA